MEFVIVGSSVTTSRMASDNYTSIEESLQKELNNYFGVGKTTLENN